jgi:predicted metal-dependent phosphoesterase TrpH
MIDLHSHSTASDGSLSPAALVALAQKRGLSALALTDHDTVAGLPEAEAAALRPHASGQAEGSPEAEAAALMPHAGGQAEGSPEAESPFVPLRLIRGVEIEIGFEPGEFHLLGLDLAPIFAAEAIPASPAAPAASPAAGRLLAALEKLGKARDERNSIILEKARAAGIPLTEEELAAAAGGSRPGRPHIAALLVAHKAAKNRQDAFSRFLAKGRPLYEPKECMELFDAMELVREAGGLAIVAHPLSLFVSWTRLAKLMDEWKEMGIDGIEAYHPTAKLGQCRRLEKMGRERGFRVTAGSDYHGDIRPERRLGRTAGGIAIEDSYLAEIAR